MTDLNFEDAAPIKQANAGRNAEPNPYVDVIAAIALKRNEVGPIAKRFTITHDATPEAQKTAFAKARRLLRAAGEKNTPSVTTMVRESEVEGDKGKTLVTFWTVKRQERKQTEKTETASTTQSTAVAAPAPAKAAPAKAAKTSA